MLCRGRAITIVGRRQIHQHHGGKVWWESAPHQRTIVRRRDGRGELSGWWWDGHGEEEGVQLDVGPG